MGPSFLCIAQSLLICQEHAISKEVWLFFFVCVCVCVVPLFRCPLFGGEGGGRKAKSWSRRGREEYTRISARGAGGPSDGANSRTLTLSLKLAKILAESNCSSEVRILHKCWFLVDKLPKVFNVDHLFSDYNFSFRLSIRLPPDIRLVLQMRMNYYKGWGWAFWGEQKNPAGIRANTRRAFRGSW